MTAIHDIVRLYNETPPGNIYHEAAGRLLRNLHSIRRQSIEEIAELCETSNTTMSRLARQLGYSGFPAFRAAIAEAVAGYPMLNRCMPYEKTSKNPHISAYFTALRELLDQLEQSINEDELGEILEAMHRSRKISLYSGFITDFTKLQMQCDLIMDGKDTAFFSDPQKQRQDADSLDGDCFVIALTGATGDAYYIMNILRVARERGAKVLAVTPVYTPGVRRYADFVIEFESSRTALDNYDYNIVTALLTIAYRTAYLDHENR